MEEQSALPTEGAGESSSTNPDLDLAAAAAIPQSPAVQQRSQQPQPPTSPRADFARDNAAALASSAASAERSGASNLRSAFRSTAPGAGSARASTPELVDAAGLVQATSSMTIETNIPPLPRGISSQQSSPRSVVPGGVTRRRGIVFNDSFTDPTESSDSSPPTQQRQASNSVRPRTRTMDAAMLVQQRAGITGPEARHRVGSMSSSVPPASQPGITDEQRAAAIAAGTRLPDPSTPKDRKASKRLLKRQSSRTTSPIPAFSSPSVDSLCIPVPAEDPSNMATLMKSLCGRMRGQIQYQSEPDGPWYTGNAFIEEDTGCLTFDSGQNGAFHIPILSDLRGCRVLPVEHPSSGKHCLEVTSVNATSELLISPPSAEDFDLWFAAFLCWQQLRPSAVKLVNGKPSNPTGPGRSDVRAYGTEDDENKTVNIIKVDKVNLWDKGPTTSPRASFRRSSTRDLWSPTASWRTVSCLLEDSGEFILLLENDTTILTMIDLTQLSRHAIQQLDRTVLNEEFCIAIFPTYTARASRISVFRPIYIALDNRIHFEVWFTLLRAFAIPDIYRLNDPGSENDELMDVPDVEADHDGEVFRMEKILTVRITEAKIKAKPSGLDLLFPADKTADPLVGNYLAEVILDGEVRARTTTKYGTKNPFWREDCEFVDLTPSVQELSVVLKRADNNVDVTLSQNSASSRSRSSYPQEFVCGVVNIALDQLEKGKDHEAWLVVRDDKQQQIGSMLIRLSHEEHIALIAKEYEPLSEILHRFPTGLTTLISASISGQLRHLSEQFLNIFQASGSAGDWLMALVEDEIDGIGSQTSMKKYRFSSRLKSNESMESSTDRELLVRDMSKSLAGEANLLFRGNTLLTQSLEFHMRRLGKEYLEEVLRNKVFEINELNPDCEVDPAKIAQTGGDLDQHWTQLIRLTNEMWHTITESASRIPAELRHILKYIRAVAEDRYGDFLRTATYTAVSGFLFLRFICPAILSPKLFGLLRDHPRPKAQRTLTLIAKVLQKLSNLSTFGKREEYMERMNRFLTTNKTSFRGFIDDVCGIPADRNVKALPANYSTPMTMLSRLSPTAREGFPSLPYLIDHPRSFAGLVKLWTTHRPADLRKSQVDGELLIFDELCMGLQTRVDACLGKIGRLRAAEAAAQGVSSPLAETLDQATMVEPISTPYSTRYLPVGPDGDPAAGSSGSDNPDETTSNNGRRRSKEIRRGREATETRKASGFRHASGTTKSRNGKVGRTLLSGIMKIGGRAESPDAKGR